MSDHPRTSPFRASLAGTVCAVAAAFLGRSGVDSFGQAPQQHLPLDRLVGSGVLALGSGAAATLAFGCLLLAAAAIRRRAGHPWAWGEATSARLTPALLRRALAVTVGAGLGLGSLGGIAGATEADLGWTVTSDRSAPSARPGDDGAADSIADGPMTTEVAADPADLPTGDVPVPPTPAVAPVGPAAGTPTGGTERPLPSGPQDAPEPSVTVRPGDSLWAIAEAHLGPGASEAEIAEAWPRWYAQNRGVIGDDPGLIHPGQVLVTPQAPSGGAR